MIQESSSSIAAVIIINKNNKIKNNLKLMKLINGFLLIIEIISFAIPPCGSSMMKHNIVTSRDYMIMYYKYSNYNFYY